MDNRDDDFAGFSRGTDLALSPSMKPTQNPQEANGGQKQKASARKAQGTDARPDPDGEKPDEAQVEAQKRSHLHLGGSQIDSEANENHPHASDDARHGYSQDSGYAQSGGQRPEPKTRGQG
jgi:hypothetical protein